MKKWIWNCSICGKDFHAETSRSMDKIVEIHMDSVHQLQWDTVRVREEKGVPRLANTYSSS